MASLQEKKVKVAILTAGGLAPCLSSAVRLGVKNREIDWNRKGIYPSKTSAAARGPKTRVMRNTGGLPDREVHEG